MRRRTATILESRIISKFLTHSKVKEEVHWGNTGIRSSIKSGMLTVGFTISSLLPATLPFFNTFCLRTSFTFAGMAAVTIEMGECVHPIMTFPAVFSLNHL